MLVVVGKVVDDIVFRLVVSAPELLVLAVGATLLVLIGANTCVAVKVATMIIAITKIVIGINFETMKLYG